MLYTQYTFKATLSLPGGRTMELCLMCARALACVQQIGQHRKKKVGLGCSNLNSDFLLSLHIARFLIYIQHHDCSQFMESPLHVPYTGVNLLYKYERPFRPIIRLDLTHTYTTTLFDTLLLEGMNHMCSHTLYSHTNTL